jgi:hypothetical protein
MDVCSDDCCVLSGTHLSDGSVTSPDEIYSLCVSVCVCVNVSTHALVSFYRT